MNRQESREWAIKIAYELEMKFNFEDDELDKIFVGHEISPSSFLQRSLTSLILHREQIDEHIAKHLEGWTLERIAKIDLAILRVAVNEIFYLDDIPTSVSINEAIEFSKIYSSEDSFKFINGILGNIVRIR
jgi:N utilization substance protein B